MQTFTLFKMKIQILSIMKCKADYKGLSYDLLIITILLFPPTESCKFIRISAKSNTNFINKHEINTNLRVCVSKDIKRIITQYFETIMCNGFP